MSQFFDKEEDIIAWLKEYKIEKYVILPDLRVDTTSSVDLKYKKLDFLPVQFNIARRDFAISGNQLTNLLGCPTEVYGDFTCSNNALKNLDFSPKKVQGTFDCSLNELESLRGAPREVGGSFLCMDNMLTSLEFGPEVVGHKYMGFNNYLKNMEFCPLYVEKTINLDGNGELEEIQKLRDLSDIYPYHLAFLKIKQEKLLLSNLLENTVNNEKNNPMKSPHKI